MRSPAPFAFTCVCSYSFHLCPFAFAFRYLSYYRFCLFLFLLLCEGNIIDSDASHSRFFECSIICASHGLCSSVMLGAAGSFKTCHPATHPLPPCCPSHNLTSWRKSPSPSVNVTFMSRKSRWCYAKPICCTLGQAWWDLLTSTSVRSRPRSAIPQKSVTWMYTAFTSYTACYPTQGIRQDRCSFSRRRLLAGSSGMYICGYCNSGGKVGSGRFFWDLNSPQTLK